MNALVIREGLTPSHPLKQQAFLRVVATQRALLDAVEHSLWQLVHDGLEYGALDVESALEVLGMSRSTFYRRLQAYREERDS